MRQKDWRDPDVVIDHLAFGEPDFRVKNLVQVRNRELFPFNHEFSFLWHTILSCRHPERSRTSSRKKSFRRQQRLWFTNAGYAMFPGLVPAQNFDFHP